MPNSFVQSVERAARHAVEVDDEQFVEEMLEDLASGHYGWGRDLLLPRREAHDGGQLTFSEKLGGVVSYLSLLEVACATGVIETAELSNAQVLLAAVRSKLLNEYCEFVRPSPLALLLALRLESSPSTLRLLKPNHDPATLFSRLCQTTRKLNQCSIRRVADSIDQDDEGVAWADVLSLIGSPERLAELALDRLRNHDAIVGEYYFMLRDFLVLSLEFDALLASIDDATTRSACFLVNDQWYDLGRDRVHAALVITALTWTEYGSEDSEKEGDDWVSDGTQRTDSVLLALRRLTTSHYRHELSEQAFTQRPQDVDQGRSVEGDRSASTEFDRNAAIQALEVAIMCSPRPVPLGELVRLVAPGFDKRGVYRLLEDLSGIYAQRAVMLVEVADGWTFHSRPEMRKHIELLRPEKAPKYSRAVVETLAIIAYRQPVTRGDVEDIRGVTVSTETIRVLEQRGWIESIGYRESPGRPALYATTRQFLSDLGLQTLEMLPAIDGSSGTIGRSEEFALTSALAEEFSSLSVRQPH